MADEPRAFSRAASSATCEPASGFTIELGGWTPPPDIDGQSTWSGSCTVTAATADASTLDCSADPEGPPQLELQWTPGGEAAPWDVDDVLDISYRLDDWADGQYLTVRDTAVGRLQLALASGGGDGGIPWLDALIEPMSFEEDLTVCGIPGEGERLPAEVTFLSEEGEDATLMQGDSGFVSDAGGGVWEVTLHTAQVGDFGSNHYGSYYDLVIRSL